VNLRPTGHAWLDQLAPRIFGYQLAAGSFYLMQAFNMRAWANQRHIADKNIPKLRQFIEACFTQYLPEPGTPRIIRPGLLRKNDAVMFHSTEFVQGKDAAGPATAVLAEDDRPRAIPPDSNGDANENGKKHDQ
jgi:hypothetical protein